MLLPFRVQQHILITEKKKLFSILEVILGQDFEWLWNNNKKYFTKFFFNRFKDCLLDDTETY